MLRARGLQSAPEGWPLHALFLPGAFGLEGCPAFLEASGEARRRVLGGCARQVLEEACGIECLGMAFAARMVQEAPTQEEQAFYAHMGAQEARHLGALEGWLPGPRRQPAGPFLGALAAWIHRGSYSTLLLLVQVVLEGWGLAHYRRLKAHAVPPGLEECLEAVLRDEAGHHRAGELLLETRPLDPVETEAAARLLLDLAKAIQAGPLGVMAVLDRELGPWKARKREAVWASLGPRSHGEGRLRILEGLLAAAAPALALRLREAGALTAPQGAHP
jgi:rubrerythrin